jgi:hypothetical protein
MTHIRRRRAVTFTLSTAFALAAAVLTAQTQDPQALGYPKPGQPGVVRLIAGGAEPRIPLRYTVPSGYKSHLDMTMEMSMGMSMSGQAMPAMALPAMKVGADLAVTAVSPTGDITYAVSYTGTTMTGGDPMMAQMLQSLDADTKSVSGTVTITNRGVNKSLSFDYSKISNPQFSQLMSAAMQSFENLALQLPEEPVGAGGRWESKQATTAGGIQQYIKTEYEVVSISGKTLSLKAKQEMMALPQPVNNSALGGATATLTKMSGTGGGTISLPLDGLVPTSTVNSTSNMLMDVSVQGQQLSMGTDVTLKMTVAPGKSGG